MTEEAGTTQQRNTTEECVAKKQRTTAKRNFTRKINVLNGLFGGDTDLEEIEACFDDVNNAFKLWS